MTTDIRDLTEEKIDYEAAALFIDYVGALRAENRYNQNALNIDDFYKLIFYQLYEYRLITCIDLGSDDRGQKILGKMLMDEKVILIDKSISPPNINPLYIITLAHEMAHVVCHEVLKENPAISGQTDLEDLIEAQADRFSEQLLMYNDLVRMRFEQFYGKGASFEYDGPHSYIIGKPGGDKSFYADSLMSYLKQVAEDLTACFFGLPKDILGLRLLKLGFIKNNSAEVLV